MTRSNRDPWKRRQRLGAGRAAVAALALAVGASGLMAGVPKAQKHERRHEIDHLEEVWRDAMLKDDTAAMSGLLAEDYMAITPTGTLQTKEEALANLHRVHFTSMEVSDRKVRFYGTTALVTSTADIEGTSPDGDISGSYRYTRVYVEGPPGVWKIVSFEANKILMPGDHAAADRK
ncbi:MAG TPA: nuclear transport factor 2 family protein [Terracidiphilus sp.]|nr:nuclear transport factor 2 family protein [Terracidiphilus sp.]